MYPLKCEAAEWKIEKKLPCLCLGITGSTPVDSNAVRLQDTAETPGVCIPS